MGGWPYGISSAKGGKIVSITLCPPQHSSLDDLSEDVRRDVNRILALMHQHVSVFRPAAGILCFELGQFVDNVYCCMCVLLL
jgi:hypothetical protein